jgi:probable HAF family extracellular repeat protein
VAGYSQLPGNHAEHAFVWQDGAMSDLGTLGGFFSAGSEATAVNNAGQVVGGSYGIHSGGHHHGLHSHRISHAFLWQNGVMTDLGTLGGKSSYANAVNDAGEVVGSAALRHSREFGTHAFLWSNGAMTDLGTLGGVDSFATGINNQGQVVGYSYTGTGYTHAFVWQGGVMTDLNSLLSNGAGWTLSDATAVNQAGQIVGYGTTPDGLIHAFLLTPDPSPAGAGRFRIDVSLAQAAGPRPIVLAAAVAPVQEQPTQPPRPPTIVDGPSQVEAVSPPTPMIALPNAQDAAFAALDGTLADTFGSQLRL